MGRRENPVDCTRPECAKLAEFLRECRHAAELTYRQMAIGCGGKVSAASFERAASGRSVPAWETVEAFILLTCATVNFHAPYVLAEGRHLWTRARRAERAPYYVHQAPDPALLAGAADFLRALRHQHVWAGYPTPGEMQRMSGPGELPVTTARRIIAGDALPVDPRQTIAFLRACDVVRATDLEQWLAAAVRSLQDLPSRARNLDAWRAAHRRMSLQAQTDEAALAPSALRQDRVA